MDAGITSARQSDEFPRDGGKSIEERLERGQLLTFDVCPFLPSPSDQDFLREQHLFRSKEIAYDVARDRLTGHAPCSVADQARLQRILADGIGAAFQWLAGLLPRQAGGITPFRACFHPEEEATRKLRMAARNDLLHVDAARHVAGDRLLRLGINLNPTDARVWVTSDTLAKVLPVYGPRCGLLVPPPAWPERLRQNVLTLFRPHRLHRSPYDDFMLAFAEFLKLCDEFQEKSPRKTWHFAPHSAWLAFTDGLVHAELRGRWVLDFMFLADRHLCLCPEVVPSRLLSNLGLALSSTRAA